jgi:hypothetical protein
MGMQSLSEIEKAVAGLPERELEAFRLWFERFEAERFDARIARDIDAGRLDAMAERALRDDADGKSRPL